MDVPGVDERWTECDRCGTCIRDGARAEGHLETLCRECRALELEGHAVADDIVSTADAALLRDGR